MFVAMFRMGMGILPVKKPDAIRTMLNFDWDGHDDGDGVGTVYGPLQFCDILLDSYLHYDYSVSTLKR